MIRTWDFRQAPEIPSPLLRTGGQVGAFDLSADGRLLAAGDDSREVLVWDLEHIDRSPIATLKVAEDITHLAFDTVGQRLAAASRSDVWVWDLGRVTVPPRRFQGPPESIVSLSFSPDGRRLAAGVQGGVILFWDIPGPANPTSRVPGGVDTPTQIAFSPDGRWLASVGFDELAFREIDGGGEPHVEHLKRDSIIARDALEESLYGGVAFSPDSQRLAAGTRRGEIRVWSLLRPSAPPTVVRGFRNNAMDVRFSPDGHDIAAITSSWGHLVRLDEVTGGVPVTSRLLPADHPLQDSATVRFLQPPGLQVRVPLVVSGESIRPTVVRFDSYEGRALEGKPEDLLSDWQRRLALKIDGDGEIVPENRLTGGGDAP